METNLEKTITLSNDLFQLDDTLWSMFESRQSQQKEHTYCQQMLYVSTKHRNQQLLLLFGTWLFQFLDLVGSCLWTCEYHWCLYMLEFLENWYIHEENLEKSSCLYFGVSRLKGTIGILMVSTPTHSLKAKCLLCLYS